MRQAGRESDPEVRIGPERDDAFRERIAQVVAHVGGVARLARLTGSSESVIRKWRLGHSEPTRRKLVSVANAAGVSVQWLAEGVPAAAAAGAPKHGQAHGRYPSASTTAWSNLNVERCLDEVRGVLAWLAEAGGTDDHCGTREVLLTRIGILLRQTARDASLPLMTRIRTCLFGAVHLGDPALGRLYQMLEPRLRSDLLDTGGDPMAVVDSLLAEAGDEPRPGIREGLHLAMAEHGLTRDGARELLRHLRGEPSAG